MAGTAVSYRLKMRKAFLSQLLLFFSAVSVEIEFISLPLADIMKKIKEEKTCGKLDFIAPCIEYLYRGESFSSSWEKAVDKSLLPMRQEEKEKLLQLGYLLGTSDANGQKVILTLYSNYFTEFYNKAEADNERYGKLTVLLGAVLGMGLFILFL